MTAHSELRLLPWSGPDGKPCYLSTDDNNSHLSRLADTAEAIQLDRAADLLPHALDVVSDGGTEPDDLRVLVTQLIGALRDLLRVAESRRHRLPNPGQFEAQG
ncbi:hypothetical protein DEJ45_16410 [Streptomyces venezuelae]|uniref:hypothetical protein n=1 Tax=Streptomyces venezuelae TaxID=54571 RepID=UPI00123D357A|nr:hypothetical protein [Streptomyces venezuelae]QES13844.1 hypothetical protein DEJ45_16410 [Streptomyces venezuelae]